MAEEGIKQSNFTFIKTRKPKSGQAEEPIAHYVVYQASKKSRKLTRYATETSGGETERGFDSALI